MVLNQYCKKRLINDVQELDVRLAIREILSLDPIFESDANIQT
jgi:hypothetical protein